MTTKYVAVTTTRYYQVEGQEETKPEPRKSYAPLQQKWQDPRPRLVEWEKCYPGILFVLTIISELSLGATSLAFGKTRNCSNTYGDKLLESRNVTIGTAVSSFILSAGAVVYSRYASRIYDPQKYNYNNDDTKYHGEGCCSMYGGDGCCPMEPNYMTIAAVLAGAVAVTFGILGITFYQSCYH